MNRGEAIQYRKSIEDAAALQSDEKALDNIYLYPKWEDRISKQVSVGERLRYGDKLYKCIQAHTAQAEWTPDITPALYAEVTIEEWPEWVRPISAETAYNIGDKVTFEGEHYISTINANTWSPAEYPAGWSKQ